MGERERWRGTVAENQRPACIIPAGECRRVRARVYVCVRTIATIYFSGKRATENNTWEKAAREQRGTRTHVRRLARVGRGRKRGTLDFGQGKRKKTKKGIKGSDSNTDSEGVAVVGACSGARAHHRTRTAHLTLAAPTLVVVFLLCVCVCVVGQ